MLLLRLIINPIHFNSAVQTVLKSLHLSNFFPINVSSHGISIPLLCFLTPVIDPSIDPLRSRKRALKQDISLAYYFIFSCFI